MGARRPLSFLPMNLSLYSAATGMEAQELNLNTIANNLANVNTPGFKKSKIEFQDLLYTSPADLGRRHRQRQPGADRRRGRQRRPGGRDLEGVHPGAGDADTGEQFDLAIQGDGFFEVQQQDGTIAYTRDGSFKLNASGQVVTSDGLPVLSGFQPVPAGHDQGRHLPDGQRLDDRGQRHHAPSS